MRSCAVSAMRMRCIWSELSISARKPPPMALRVVSAPAGNSSMKKFTSSRSVSGPPSWPSSPGSRRARMIAREDVVGGIGALLGDQLEAVVAQLQRILARDDLAGGLGDPGIDPLGKLRAFLLRHAEQKANRLQGQVAREAGHEVERLMFRQSLDQRHSAAAQLGLERQDGPRRKALVDERAETLVLRIVHPDQHGAGLAVILQPRAAVRAAAALVRREGLGIGDHRHAILVAGDHPEALTLRRMLCRLMPIDRRVGPCPGEMRVRKAVGEGPPVGQVVACVPPMAVLI